MPLSHRICSRSGEGFAFTAYIERPGNFSTKNRAARACGVRTNERDRLTTGIEGSVQLTPARYDACATQGTSKCLAARRRKAALRLEVPWGSGRRDIGSAIRRCKVIIAYSRRRTRCDDCATTNAGGRTRRCGQDRSDPAANAAFRQRKFAGFRWRSRPRSLQPIGAFKMRGAWHRLTAIDERARDKRRGRLLVGQSRAGSCLGGEAAGHAGGDRDAGRRAQGRSATRRWRWVPKSSAMTA